MICKPSLPVSGIIVGCLSVLMGACDLQEPDRYVRPPVIKTYSPKDASLSTVVGDTLVFSIAAEDPQGQYLDVQGCVSNGVSESVIEWRLTRAEPVNLPPEITGVFPPKPEVSLIVGDVIEFVVSAIDPENDPLSYVYSIGGAIVSVTRRYTHEASAIGVFDLRAIVSDGESFVSHTWTLHVAAEPDSIPPARVAVVSLVPGAETGEVDIEWVAVGDDSLTGLPAYYVVRTSPVPINDENGWTSASDRDGEPTAAPPGQIMRMTVRNLPPANTVFVAVRAVDDFGLVSELSALASTKARGMKVSGVVRDAVTGEPVEGVRVTLVSAADTTNADGSFLLSELPAVPSFIRLEDEPWRTELGEYFDIVMSPYTIRDNDFLNFSMLPNTDLDTDAYQHFLEFFKLMTSLDGCNEIVLARWNIPCKVYIPPRVIGDLDYRATIRNAFLEWERLIGLDAVDFVEAVPDTGLYVTYGEPERDLYIITQRDANCLPVQGRINFRTSYTTPSDSLLILVARHEIGHALRLNHSMDDLHIMYDTPQVMHPSADETLLIRAVYRIPRGYPFRWLLSD
jgi:hypothetical protein